VWFLVACLKALSRLSPLSANSLSKKSSVFLRTLRISLVGFLLLGIVTHPSLDIYFI
jgi:hypothetical protein